MKPDNKKTNKEQKEEIDFTKFTPDDIARRVLATPPKPKKKEKKQD